jgi:hypothetical protein
MVESGNALAILGQSRNKSLFHIKNKKEPGQLKNFISGAENH